MGDDDDSETDARLNVHDEEYFHYMDEDEMHDEMQSPPNHGYGLDELYINKEDENEVESYNEMLDKLARLDGVSHVPQTDAYSMARERLSAIQEAIGICFGAQQMMMGKMMMIYKN